MNIHDVKNMFIEGGINAISGMLSATGGYLAGLSGYYHPGIKKHTFGKFDILFSFLIKNVFTSGFAMIFGIIKSWMEGKSNF